MTAEELLTINPILAAKMMAARLLGHPATKDWFVVKKIQGSTTDQICDIYLEYNELYVPLAYRYGKEDPIKISLSKIDLSLLNDKGPIHLNISSIFTNRTYVELLREKYSDLGIVFADTDIEDRLPDINDTAISASSKSIRWYGSLEVSVKLIIENINKFIKRNSVVLDYSSEFTEDNLLYDLVSGLNRINITELPIPISASVVSFKDSIPHILDNETERYNTKIVLTFGYPYSGDLEVQYNRRNFHRTFNDPVHIKDFGDITIDKVLAEINTKLDSGLTLDELEPFTIPTEMVRGNKELKEGKYVINIKESSIAHFGDIWITLEKKYEP